MLNVDGKEIANHPIPHTIPFLLTFDKTFDVGSDTRTPVDDKDYQVPFRFSGKISKVSVKLGRSTDCQQIARPRKTRRPI